jgi:hypothetical protein
MSGLQLGRRRFVLAGGLLAVATPTFGQSAPPPLIPRRLLFAGAERSRVTISPDGRLIAFLGPLDGVQNVWLAPLADPAAARPITRVTDRDLANELWWPFDSRHLVFFREQGGDENWQAHSVDVETGAIRALTPGPGVRAYVQQVSARFPGELLIAHNQRDKAQYDIHRVKVATGESELVFRNDQFAWNFTDPHFRLLYGARYRSDGGWDVIKAAGEGAGSLFRRVEAADGYTTRLIEVADDGTELYWLDSRVV